MSLLVDFCPCLVVVQYEADVEKALWGNIEPE